LLGSAGKAWQGQTLDYFKSLYTTGKKVLKHWTQGQMAVRAAKSFQAFVLCLLLAPLFCWSGCFTNNCMSSNLLFLYICDCHWHLFKQLESKLCLHRLLECVEGSTVRKQL